jgi:chromosome segregation and condensation protein ScpB
MQEGITDADLQMLLSANPLAAEQLRRIIAERNRTELQAEIDAFKASSNSVGTEVDVANNSNEFKTMAQVAE